MSKCEKCEQSSICGVGTSVALILVNHTVIGLASLVSSQERVIEDLKHEVGRLAKKIEELDNEKIL